MCSPEDSYASEGSEKDYFALIGVVQWVGCCSTKLKVASLIPSQNTCLGCTLGLQVMFLSHTDVSLRLSPSLPLSLKISKILFKRLLWHFRAVLT